MAAFSAASLEAAFRDLARELRRRRVRGHIYVIGGAAFALGFDSRRYTMDVDVLIKRAAGAVTAASRQVALRHGWAEDWLNEDAVPLIPSAPDGRARTVYEDAGLVVTAASAEHLLAMKLRASRPKDREDIEFLVGHLGLSSAKEAIDLHDEVFSWDPMPLFAYRYMRRMLADIWPDDRSLEGDGRNDREC